MPPETVRRLDSALRAMSSSTSGRTDAGTGTGTGVRVPKLEYLGTRSLSNVTVCQQACLFRDVTLAIGAHGQELVNAVWMPPGSAVLELAAGERTGTGRWWYSELCRGAGIRHSALPSIAPGVGAFEEAVRAAAAAVAAGGSASA